MNWNPHINQGQYHRQVSQLMEPDVGLRQRGARYNKVIRKLRKPTEKLNTIHLHPSDMKEGLLSEKRLLSAMRQDHGEKELRGVYRKIGVDPGTTRRLIESQRSLVKGLGLRHRSHYPALRPSGYHNKRYPLGAGTSDVGVFITAKPGTHHNILHNSGVGVHTTRQKGQEKFLRTTLWEGKK